MNRFKTIGQTIRQLRKERNISIEQISSKTKISVKVLNILENGERERFLAPVFMEGFLRNYLLAIGEEPDELTGQMRSLFLEEEKEKEAKIKKRLEQKKAVKKNLLRAASALFLLVAVIYAATSLNTKTKPPARVLLQTQPKTIESPKEVNSDITNIAELAQEKKNVKKPDYFTLKIITRQKSWFFYKIDDNQAKSGFIEAGSTVNLKAKNNLIATFGNSFDMHIFFDGKQVLIPKRVVHLKCNSGGCTILSAKQWQNIILKK